MTSKSNNFILNLFFYALMLTALTACGGGSGGGGGGGGAAKTPLPPDIDPIDDVDPANPNADVVFVTPPASDSTPDAFDDSRYIIRAAYTPSDGVSPPEGFASWDLAVADIQAGSDYQRSRHADEIRAAYAHARGYSGAGITVSNMGRPTSRGHADLNTQVLTGYTADSGQKGSEGGDCSATDVVCDASNLDSNHLAAIIVGRQHDDFGIQGIAYDAGVKSIDILSGDVSPEELNVAIGEASGSDITVMNNGWNVSGVGRHTDSSTPTFYKTANKISTINTAERDAWKKAVETTVVVFPAGDYGHNSENGMVKLYTEDTFDTPHSPAEKAWNEIDSLNRNIASSHARLPLEAVALQGKWLTVIALEDVNPAPNTEEMRIADFSNGCGDTKAYCLGAPGVRVYSATISSYEERDGTAQAAAFVSGAVAVLKGAFPNLTPTQLVSVILNTADPLGIIEYDDGNNALPNDIYGHGALNLARAVDPIGSRMTATPSGTALDDGITIDNSGITLPTSFGGALDGFTTGFIDDYNRAYIGTPTRITQKSVAFTLADTIATWDSPELQNIQLDSNSKMQFSNYDASEDAKDTLIFTHHLPNHTVGFAYNEESKSPDLNLLGTGSDLHFQKIRPIASDLMQVNATHKLGKAWNVKNAITTGEFDTGNRFNEAMANLNYASENRNLTIGAGTLKEYGQFLGASGTGAYQLSDATQSTITHLAITQNLPKDSAIKVKYTGFKTEVDMRYNNFAKINDLTADEYQLSFSKRKIWGKHDSLNIELIQPLAVTDGELQQSTVLGYTADGNYNNVTQNFDLKPTNRRQQLRMTWQNQINLERKTKLFISMQYENHVNNLRDNNDSQILGGISTRF